MTSVRVSLLGHPVVERDGAAVQVDTRKAIALLAYLAVKERAQSRDTLAALLWSEYDAERARAALRRTLSTLRAALGDGCLVADRRTVELRGELLDIDVRRLRSGVHRAREHGHDVRAPCETCLPALTQALAAARGDFLEGFSLRDAPEFDDWQLAEAETLRQDLAHVLEGAGAACALTGDLATAIAYAHRWLALDPLHEPAHRALMRLYSAAGERAAALRQYRECVRILEEELAVGPVEETTRLYHLIKEGQEPAPQPSRRARPDSPAAPLPLVGRAREWGRLIDECDAMHSEARVVALEGEAGIGKTRLMDELILYARSTGAVTLSARCWEGEAGLAYAPIVQLLRAAIDVLERTGTLAALPADDIAEVGRLLPGTAPGSLAGEAPRAPHQNESYIHLPPIEGPATHVRFLEAVVRTLLTVSEGPIVLAIDDMQWADAASRECILYLLRRLGDRPSGLVLAWRSEALPPSNLLVRAVAEAERRGRGAIIRLERLDRASVEQLVTGALPQGDSGQIATLTAWLFAETEGLPLFLREYLSALQHGADLHSLPGGVRELLESRLSALSELGSQFLTVAAVIGRSFDYETLHEVSGRDDEMSVAALEELTSLGLVAEDSVRQGGAVSAGAVLPGDTPMYDFSHEKLRTLVYERTSLARRRLLHRRVAETLAAQGRRRGDDAQVASIAQHFLQAGCSAEAGQFFARAGARARSMFANREALAHYEAALALGHGDVATLEEILGDLHALLGEYRAAVTRYESAAARCGGADAARLEHKLGKVYDRWGDWDLADAHFEAALAGLAGSPAADRAQVYADRAMAAHHWGDDAAAAELAGSAASLAEEGRDELAMARVQNILGVLAAGRGDLAAAAGHLRQSLARAERVADPGARAAALHNLALVEGRAGNHREALELVQQALAISTLQGDRHQEAALRNTMADLLHGGGDPEAAMEHLKQAVTIFAEIGLDAGEMRPGVWKLVEF